MANSAKWKKISVSLVMSVVFGLVFVYMISLIMDMKAPGWYPLVTGLLFIAAVIVVVVLIASISVYPEFGEKITPAVCHRIQLLSPEKREDEVQEIISVAMRLQLGSPEELVELQKLLRKFYTDPIGYSHFPSIDEVRHAQEIAKMAEGMKEE